jgi:hypothetical protein
MKYYSMYVSVEYSPQIEKLLTIGKLKLTNKFCTIDIIAFR